MSLRTRLRVNLSLLAVVGVLLTLAVYRPGQQAPSPDPYLTSLRAEAIARLEIRRAAQPPMRFEKTGEEWYMHAPYTAPANDFLVRSVLRLAQAPSLARYPWAGLDAARYGLAVPQVELLFDDQLVGWGDTEPAGGRRYVRAGDSLHLIHDSLGPLLTSGAPAFVSRALLPPGAQVVGLSLPALQLERQDGRWRSQPQQALDSADQANALAQAWEHTQAHDVQPYRSENPPAIHVRLSDRDALAFEVLATEPDLILGRPDLGLKYMLGAEATQLLELPAVPEPTQDPPDA